ncbi:hypothetical protein EC604_18780 [Paenibacillus amylolyticus]|uniref:Uncharacterized protein n=1 Tax=Paenibacillus amylolyticus TaxID=1451 RepID=A0A5M9WWW5_PAEAM|nr:hypothetical protein EC604_18780 [Paenibacillus amylolyticus]
MVCAVDHGLTNKPTLVSHCLSLLCSGASVQALRADVPFARHRARQERRHHDALEERSVRL